MASRRPAWNEAIRDLFERLAASGHLRPMPFYLFYFLVTSPTSIYSQPPLARRLGRPEEAQDHEQLTALVLASVLADHPPPS